MMRRLTIVLVVFLAGCATSSQQLEPVRQPVDQGCEIYTIAKPRVITWREWAIENWTEIDKEMRMLLLDVEQWLPFLDDVGQKLCLASDGFDVLLEPEVDMNKVLDVVLRGAAAYYAAQAGGR